MKCDTCKNPIICSLYRENFNGGEPIANIEDCRMYNYKEVAKAKAVPSATVGIRPEPPKGITVYELDNSKLNNHRSNLLSLFQATSELPDLQGCINIAVKKIEDNNIEGFITIINVFVTTIYERLNIEADDLVAMVNDELLLGFVKELMTNTKVSSMDGQEMVLSTKTGQLLIIGNSEMDVEDILFAHKGDIIND